MKKNSDKKLYFYTGVISLVLLAASIFLTYAIARGDETVAVLSTSASGTAKVQFQVLEGYSETPIQDAKVYILETGQYYSTDENGNTDTIEVPIVPDSRFDGYLKKPWGEISLIVYRDGYMPYALFYLQVSSAKQRDGVKILMFKQEQKDADPFSIIEGPNKLWVNELIEKYAPDD